MKVGLNPNDWCPHTRGTFGHETETHTGRTPCEHKGRDQSDTPSSQGMPKSVSGLPKARVEAWTHSHQPMEKPCWHPDLQPPVCETKSLLLFKPHISLCIFADAASSKLIHWSWCREKRDDGKAQPASKVSAHIPLDIMGAKPEWVGRIMPTQEWPLREAPLGGAGSILNSNIIHHCTLITLDRKVVRFLELPKDSNWRAQAKQSVGPAIEFKFSAPYPRLFSSPTTRNED